jgi:von Willebrand factor type A domain/Inner membrane component of T3SS, cytoplasmic domain
MRRQPKGSSICRVVGPPLAGNRTPGPGAGDPALAALLVDSSRTVRARALVPVCLLAEGLQRREDPRSLITRWRGGQDQRHRNRHAARLLGYLSFVLHAKLFLLSAWALFVGFVAAPSPTPEEDHSQLVAVLFDTSGVIRGQELRRARELVREVLENLPEKSAVEVYTFDENARLVARPTSEPENLEHTLITLRIHSMIVDLIAALGDVLAEPSDLKPNSVLLLTDGARVSRSAQFDQLVQDAKLAGIPVFVVGTARAHAKLLQDLAEKSGGEYFSIHLARGSILAKKIEAVRAQRSSLPTSAARSALKDNASYAMRLAEPSKSARFPKALWGDVLVFLAAAGLAATGIRQIPMMLLRRRQHRRPENPVVALTPALELPPRPTPVTALVLCPKREKEQAIPPLSRLVLKSGKGEGNVFTLNRLQATIVGGDPASAVFIHDPLAAAMHCKIAPADGEFVLHDLSGHPGTVVNAHYVQSHVLNNGDQIRIGNTLVEFISAPE